MKATKKGTAPRVADQILEGLKEAVAFERGELADVRVDRVLITARAASATPPPEFKSDRIIDLRKNKMGVSQAVFASALNVSPETVRAWEQGRNSPGGPALRLLEIAEAQPTVILSKVAGKGMHASVVRVVPRPKSGFFKNLGGHAGKILVAKGTPKRFAAATKKIVGVNKGVKVTRKK